MSTMAICAKCEMIVDGIKFSDSVEEVMRCEVCMQTNFHLKLLEKGQRAHFRSDPFRFLWTNGEGFNWRS